MSRTYTIVMLDWVLVLLATPRLKLPVLSPLLFSCILGNSSSNRVCLFSVEGPIIFHRHTVTRVFRLLAKLTPSSLMEVVDKHLGNYLETSNADPEFPLTGKQPANKKCISGRNYSPSYGLHYTFLFAI